MLISPYIGNETESVIDEVELKIQVKRLYNKMKAVLKKREKTVLELRYGLLNGTSKTQREIAGMLGISRSYVSRIEKKAIKNSVRSLSRKAADKVKRDVRMTSVPFLYPL